MTPQIRAAMVLTVTMMIAMGLGSMTLTAVHASPGCTTVNGDACSPIGVGFNNLSLFPYLMPASTGPLCTTVTSVGGCAPLTLNTTMNIQTNIIMSPCVDYSTPCAPESAPVLSEEGCGSYDTAAQDAAAFTYQNNFFDPNGEVIQEVLTVGFPPNALVNANSGACFTIETNPAGDTQTYDYAAVDISLTSPVNQPLGGAVPTTCYICDQGPPVAGCNTLGSPCGVTAATLMKFYTAGNSIGFDIVSKYASTANGVTQLQEYILTLNGQPAASILTSAISAGGGADTTYHGCNLIQPYECSNSYPTSKIVNGTEQNFNIIGQGDGATIVFAQGNGTLTYCGTQPATGLGGVVGYGGGTLEDSNTGYGNLTSTGSNCSQGPSGAKIYSQPFCMGDSTSASCVVSTPLPTPEFPLGTVLSIVAPLAAVGLYVGLSVRARRITSYRTDGTRALL